MGPYLCCQLFLPGSAQSILFLKLFALDAESVATIGTNVLIMLHQSMQALIYSTVEITGGELYTLQKKDGVFVEMVAVSYKFIGSCRQQPNLARDKGLMVVAQNHLKYIGKLT
ncbi:hypothetical protein BT96DRAFT_946808 [Gymnopus androsaceus JB14]|uniref:Uncharacterized protein n=1 Tax=Gymnopus androsaceus JB14 TaxID=1447944 RepID=A0A6A4GVM1_9AGAR|nr:hypothetical protein BT96DRAFT_946808 [Gymnopus androsaceus JB14]